MRPARRFCRQSAHPHALPPPRHKGKFELTYVSKAAVIVKTLATGARIVLKSGAARQGAAPLACAMRRCSAVCDRPPAPSPSMRPEPVYGYEVSKVAVYQGRYIVGRTHATLLLVRGTHRMLRPIAGGQRVGAEQ